MKSYTTYTPTAVIRSHFQLEGTGHVLVFYENEGGFGDLSTAENGKTFDFPLPTREKAECLRNLLNFILDRVGQSG